MFFYLNYTLLYLQKIFASEPTVYHLDVHSMIFYLTNAISEINYVHDNGSIKIKSISTVDENLKEDSEVYKNYFDICDIICKCIYDPRFNLKHVKTSISREINIFVIDDLPVLIRDTSNNEYFFIGFEIFNELICIKLCKCLKGNVLSFHLYNEVLYCKSNKNKNSKIRKYSEIKNYCWYKKLENSSNDLILKIWDKMFDLFIENQSITE